MLAATCKQVQDISLLIRTKWMMKKVTANLDPSELDLQFCYDALQYVSRSFAVVIIQLTDRDLRDAVCLFYLVLRALDTIEDDMKLDSDLKIKELEAFHTRLEDPTWSLSNVGEGKEREVLENYPRVTREFKKLRPEYQVIIHDICFKMAAGMVQVLKNPVVTVADYNLYCHYVAGLVGHGITRMFACCLPEYPKDFDLDIANQMGLFLQKTNIIRDYFEDIREVPPRMFWPKEIWGLYAKELKDLAEPANKQSALRCINHMVRDALTHIPAVLKYMEVLTEPSMIRFCGIPQSMAIGTLAEVYNNADTVRIKVKMSKVAACGIMLGTNNLGEFLADFKHYSKVLLDKLDDSDAQSAAIRMQLTTALAEIDVLISKHSSQEKAFSVMTLLCAPLSLLLKGEAAIIGLFTNLRIKSHK